MGLESIGKHISEFRHLRKLRQEDLAEITGLSTNYIGAVERGEKIPSLETFIDILNALSISADMVLSDVLQEGYQVIGVLDLLWSSPSCGSMLTITHSFGFDAV